MIYVLIVVFCFVASHIDAMEKGKRREVLERRFTQNEIAFCADSKTIALFREQIKDEDLFPSLLEEALNPTEENKKHSQVIAMSSLNESMSSLAESCSTTSSPREPEIDKKDKKLSWDEQLTLEQIENYKIISDNWRTELERRKQNIIKDLNKENMTEAENKYKRLFTEFNRYVSSDQINEVHQSILSSQNKRRFRRPKRGRKKKKREIVARINEAQEYLDGNKNALRNWFSTVCLQSLQEHIQEKAIEEYEKVAKEVKDETIITKKSIPRMQDSLNRVSCYYDFASIIRLDCSTKFNIESQVQWGELPGKVTTMRSYLNTALNLAKEQVTTDDSSIERTSRCFPERKAKSGINCTKKQIAKDDTLKERKAKRSFPERKNKSGLIKTGRYKNVREYFQEKNNIDNI